MRALLVLLIAATAFADNTIPPRKDAREPGRALPLHALRGPFASPEAYCAQLAREDQTIRACTVERRLPDTAALLIRAGIRRWILLAVENRGWWIDEQAGRRVTVLFDAGTGRGGFVIEKLGGGGGGARLRGV